MMQGDQYRIPIQIKHEDGSVVTKSEIDDIEVLVGTARKTLLDGVSFDNASKNFYVYLTQKETFRMSGDTKVQARLLFTSGDIVGVSLGTINIETSTSKVVLLRDN